MADIDFYFDPICPFAWMTSKWVRLVMEQRDYTVDWKFISLRIVNAKIDYESHFPEGYDANHTSGLRMLRVAAATRAEAGNEGVGRLYRALGQHTFETGPEPKPDQGRRGTREFVAPVLAELDLPERLVDALDDPSWDEVIRTETEHALSLTGRDVGTPIIQFRPPEGVAFFGPVISRLPDRAQAGQLWDHVIGLAAFPGFAEMKRSARERVQLPSEGVAAGQVGQQEEWFAGSRKQPA